MRFLSGEGAKNEPVTANWPTPYIPEKRGGFRRPRASLVMPVQPMKSQLVAALLVAEVADIDCLRPACWSHYAEVNPSNPHSSPPRSGKRAAFAIRLSRPANPQTSPDTSPPLWRQYDPATVGCPHHRLPHRLSHRRLLHPEARGQLDLHLVFVARHSARG